MAPISHEGSLDPNQSLAEVKELAQACELGNEIRVRQLLQRHPDVLDSPDRDTRFVYPESCLWSPLYVAAMHGQEPIVRLLLEMGANPVPYEVGAQYHHHTYGHWMDELRERGHDAVAESIAAALQTRYGPLVDEGNIGQAVIEGDTARVQELVDEKPERVRQVDAVGNTPLHMAVAANNLDMVRLLLASGSQVDVQNGDGRTPAVVALFGLHRWWRNEEKPEVLAELIHHGAAYSMLIAATVGDQPRVQELLEADASLAGALDPCYRRPLSGAASRGHTQIVRLLLEHGADPNAKEAVCQGGFSLRDAAGKGFIDVVRLLLEHGAVPEHWVDSSGDALFGARHGGHTDILNLLYSFGGTMELQVYAAAHRIDVIAEVLHRAPSEASGVLPYGWEDGGSEEVALSIMRLAICCGARFEGESEWKLRWTALKYPKVFRLLQEHGANADLPLLGIAGDMRKRYESPTEQLRTIAFLVEECGANVNYRDAEGFTPLARAAAAGSRDIVEYLLERGATVRSDGAPPWAQPLSLAEHRGHAEIAELLRRRQKSLS